MKSSCADVIWQVKIMGMCIQICGLNGCGKSTLGKALAARMGLHFIDNENLYFSRSNEGEPYGNARSREEVERLLAETVKEHPDFVFAAVKGDYGSAIQRMYNYVVLIEAPKSVRMQRVRNRSFGKFGNRMLEGGDLFSQEEAFFQMVEAREDEFVENWLEMLNCPVIRVDGTRPIEENIEYIIRVINK